MKKLFFLLTGIFCANIVFGQNYVSPELVAPVVIENLVANPEKPSGFRLANVDFLTSSPDYASSAMIVDSVGEIVWRYTSPLNLTGRAGSIFNFKRINDTTMVWYTFENGPGYYLVLNNDYSVRDTVNSIGNVGRMRPHDLLILPNGNYLSMANVFQRIDSSLHGIEVKPGIILDSSISTIENIWIQEINTNGNLLKEWQSLDYVNPVATWDTSKISSNTGVKILHTNSLDYFFNQGQLKLLTSNRESNELMIIDWNTGSIEERIGGRNATMSFVASLYSGDKLDLYGQHYAKVYSWDEINQKLLVRVFNNKYNQSQAEAWVIDIDLTNGIIRKNVEIISTPKLLSTHLGNFDNYKGDNWVVNWGRTYSGRENATGYNRFGQKQFNLFLPDSVDSYRILPVETDEMDALKANRPVITQNGCTLTASSTGYWSDGTTFGNEFPVIDTGIYFIETKYGIGWIRSQKVVIETTNNECGTVGVSELNSTEKISIYPNPTTGKVYVQNVETGETIRLIDMMGKEIFSQTVTSTNAEIDMSQFPAGVYSLITESEQFVKVIKK